MDRNKLFVSSVGHDHNSNIEGDATGARIWDDVLSVLAMRLTADEFSRWIADLRLVAEDDGVMLLAARDPVALDRVSTRHQREIERLWKGIDPLGRPLRLVCWRSLPAERQALIGDPWAEAAEARPASAGGDGGGGGTGGETDAPSGQRPMTFDNLVTGPSNQIAVGLAKRLAAGLPSGTPVTLIYGPQGTGKTHLMLAMKFAIAQRDAKRVVVYVTAEEFMSAYLDGVKARDTSGLKRRLRNATLLIIDDLHRIAGKPGTENELFQNIREVTGNGGQVVLVGDTAPGETVGFGPRLRSEIKGATAVEIGLPDPAMRREILLRLSAFIAANHPDFLLGDDMVDKLNDGIRGPGRELTGAIWSLYTEAGFGSETPTAEMLERVIRRHSGKPREPSMEEIKKATLKIFPIAKADLEGPSKMRAFVYPRQIAMYLCRTMTKKSFPQIGGAFGDRDHTTVLYAFRRITKQIANDAKLAEDIARVEAAVLDGGQS